MDLGSFFIVAGLFFLFGLAFHPLIFGLPEPRLPPFDPDELTRPDGFDAAMQRREAMRARTEG